MTRSRWINDEKLTDWFDKQLGKLNNMHGADSGIDAILDYVGDKHLFSFCPEGLKPIDIINNINIAVDFGMDVKDNKIFYFYFNNINFYFLARNKTEFKHMILTAIRQWKDNCLIESEKPKPSRDERLKSLLEEIRNSHIGDTKGQNDQEAAWCAEIDELVELL